MPIYEQKLICPLAVRFTQEHIRTTFRDGRLVEASIQEIQGLSGQDNYDVLLQAPFPNIEIIRWSPHGSNGGEPESSYGDGHRDGDHWFTLDNRRLYCLQRAAATHWPKRVAAVVDILYADPGRVWAKYDSMTRGKSVSIGHSCKGPELSRWDWLAMTLPSGAPAACTTADDALQAVWQDDRRGGVSALLNAPDEPGSLVALVHSTAPLEQLLKSGCFTPSTTAASEDSEDAAPAQAPTPSEILLLAVKKGLAGVWYGGKGETYRFRFGSETSWTCTRQAENGTKAFSVYCDLDNDVIWWGTAGAYYFLASQAAEEPDELQVYAAEDYAMQKPKFVWHRRGCGSGITVKAGQAAAEPSSAKEQPSVPVNSYPAGKWQGKHSPATSTSREAPAAALLVKEDGSGLAATALAEIVAQLRDPVNQGYVWIPTWNERYLRRLGTLRSFLEGHPSHFTVTPGRGNRYSVLLVGNATDEGAKRKAGLRGIASRKWKQRHPV